ncbi:MAG: hypothetical protein ACLFR1_02500 [Spirochaetia bacterium]
MENKKKRNFARSGIRLFKLGRNILNTVFDDYFLNRFENTQIHNDLGASFTNLKRVKNRIRKEAHDRGEAKLIDEINWYLQFQNTPLKKHIPKVYDYSIEKGNVFYEMKYYNYANLRKVIINDMNAQFFLNIRWRKLISIMLNHFYQEKNSIPAPEDFLENAHLKKLRTRTAETEKYAPFLVPILQEKTILINGRFYLNPELIINEVQKDTGIQKKLIPRRLYLSHGDIHCNNILCGISAKKLILLDPRGKSPDNSSYFDVAYDVAKLYHDLRSYYSLIEKHMFSIFLLESERGVAIEYEFTSNRLMEKFKENFQFVRRLIESQFTDFGNVSYRADFTEALLYLTMVPLHLKSKAEGLMCLTTGILRLNEWFEANHKELYDALIAKNAPKK